MLYLKESVYCHELCKCGSNIVKLHLLCNRSWKHMLSAFRYWILFVMEFNVKMKLLACIFWFHGNHIAYLDLTFWCICYCFSCWLPCQRLSEKKLRCYQHFVGVMEWFCGGSSRRRIVKVYVFHTEFTLFWRSHKQTFSFIFHHHQTARSISSCHLDLLQLFGGL